GKIELHRERASLAEILRSAIETSRPHIEAARHQLTVQWPPGAAPIDAAPVRMAQVFSNLLNNAAKYTRPGGSIDVKVEARPDRYMVHVRDNGVGISPEMLGKIFAPFTQDVHPARRSQGGLGIGLSLVEGLVRLHGGRVEAHSPGLDQGSEFTVRLPRPAGERGASGQAAVRPHVPAAPTSSARRLLVVDDNEDAANTVAELLQMGGNAVEVAGDGTTAVAKVAEFRPDVVLLDIGLPDIDGYEVARRIRKLEGVRQPILIALTGWGQQQDKEAAAAAGFDHHWTKPVDPARLQELSAR
ncbi:MAG: hybrid sensor histidine kinase/response regulator, partial [Ramlibacter sp.]